MNENFVLNCGDRHNSRHSEQKWNESLSELLAGNYDIGWPAHEWIRTGSSECKNVYEPTPTLSKTVWQGKSEPITLLINSDFGMGDTIQFWRFIPLVKERVSRVILRCDDDFRHLFQGVDLIGKDDTLPEFDKIIHMMALPRVLGIKKSDISGKPYLKPVHDFPMNYLLNCAMIGGGFKIGVCLNGNPFNTLDHFRSLPDCYLQEFNKGEWQKLSSTCQFYSLDKLFSPPHHSYIDCRNYMRDWNATAQIVAKLNLVVSVDTAVAHLAGAMGITTFIPLRIECPHWSWGLEGDKTIWYDSATLFRNKAGWKDVLDCMADEICAKKLDFALQHKSNYVQ